MPVELSGRFRSMSLDKQIDSVWRTKDRDIPRLAKFIDYCKTLKGLVKLYQVLDSVHRERMDNLIHIYNLTQEDNMQIDAAERLGMRKKFEALESVVDLVARGNSNGLLVLGSGGIGKTFSVEKVLKASKVKYVKMNGYVSHTALYNFLYEHRNELCLIDDADSVFDDETPINILKAVLDTVPIRVVSWLTPSPAISVPSFSFSGKAIFITNMPMDKIRKSVAHMEALLTRILFVNFEVSKEDILGRMREIASDSSYKNIRRDDRMKIYSFIKRNKDRIVDLNLRTLIHAYDVFMYKKKDWQKCLRFMWAVRV